MRQRVPEKGIPVASYGESQVDDFEDTPRTREFNSVGGGNLIGLLDPGDEAYLSDSIEGHGSKAPITEFFHETDGLLAGWNNEVLDQAFFILNIPTDKKDVSTYPYLSFRIMQIVGENNSLKQDLDFEVGLEDERGRKAVVPVSRYARIPFPYGRPDKQIAMLQTVRLGVACFSQDPQMKIDPAAIKAIYFRFNRRLTGLVAIDSIQFTE